MKCPYCGAEVQGKFCSYCGSELPKAQSITNVTDNSHTTIINNYYGYQNASQQNPEPNISEEDTDFYTEPEVQEETQKKPPASDPSLKWTLFWFVVFFPVGIIRMWKRKQFTKNLRILLTITFVLIFLAAPLSGNHSTSQSEVPTSQEYNIASPTPSSSPSPTPCEFDSMGDAFKQGFEDGLGNTTERKRILKESVDSIKESTDEILSE